VPLTDLQRFNTVVGTQTIGAAYQFTDKPLLLETAQAILDMGSNVLKFHMSKDYAGKPGGDHKGRNVPEPTPGIDSLVELARDEPTHRAVLDMPFASYIIWVYPFHGGWWSKGFSEHDAAIEYQEIHDLACHLFRLYSGTGKTFYLGHWEGDWHLRSGYVTGNDDAITDAAIQGMADWLNTRQRAVDDARRETPHEAVEVYNYTEVNLVQIAMQGRRSVSNDVLPKTNVDFVSYSSYDSGTNLKPALDYIESKLPPKPGLPGKRVWIGEYGFPSCNVSDEKQEELSREVMRAGLEWGCPFVLYWEMYNNEIDDQGQQRGFWLIDNLGVKRPLYQTHQRYYAWARQWATDFQAAHGRLPGPTEFGPAAAAFLRGRP
jgi:hypothetical protein